jgi:hypothetical protein
VFFVMFIPRVCNVYTFIYITPVFLCLHNRSVMFTLLFTHTMSFCYVYLSGVQCLHFYFYRTHIFVVFTWHKCYVYTFIYAHTCFYYVYLTLVQVLHFYFIPQVVFNLHNAIAIFTLLFITGVQYLHIYLHTTCVFVKFTSRFCNVYTFLPTPRVLCMFHAHLWRVKKTRVVCK